MWAKFPGSAAFAMENVNCGNDQRVTRYETSRKSGTSCSVRGCHNNRRKLNDLLCTTCYDHKPLLRQDCPCPRPYAFHKLPSDPDMARMWKANLRLKNPPNELYVCSFHFVEKSPSKEHPAPELFLGYERQVKHRRILTRCRDDSLSVTDTSASVLTLTGSRKRKIIPDTDHRAPCVKQKRLSENYDVHVISVSCAKVKTSPVADKDSSLGAASELQSESSSSNGISSSAVETQWTDFSLEDHQYCQQLTASRRAVKGTQCKLREEENLTDRLLKTDNDSRLYSGVNLTVFKLIVECMTPVAKVAVRMSVSDQILMCLMKLRLNLVYADLARRFGVSESFVSKNISFWISKLSKYLSELIVWLPREVIRATLPESFKHFPKTTCIIDCAETILQKPSNLKARAESYSNYKSHNTVKFCVTIAPSGVIMHISKAYGGRSSDKFIVQDCGLLDRLIPGDEVMADRGFTIQDLLFAKMVKLNIPAFSHGKQLSEEEVTRTRRIAHVRIHVERAIRRMKVFKILKDVVPITMSKKINKILRIIAALVNLDTDLIRARTQNNAN